MSAEHDAADRLREMNEALLISGLRQHELAEQARAAESALRESERILEHELTAARHLQEVSTRMIREGRVEAMYEHIIDAAVAMVCADFGTMHILDAGGTELSLLASRGFEPRDLPALTPVRADTPGACSSALRAGARVIFEDVEAAPELAGTAGLEAYRRCGIRTVQATPLVSRAGEILGMISTHWRRPHRPLDRELGLIVVLARQAADLIERQRADDARVQLEQELSRAAAALADGSRRKDEFLAMLSHELRNPLAPIRSAVHLLKVHGRNSENPAQQRAREIIERQADNLDRIVSDLLEVSRVISGRIRLHRQHVELDQVVECAAESVRPLIENSGHSLNMSVSVGAAGGLWVSADVTRLEEVFINLLGNAAKYTPDGGTIDVVCERHPDRGRALARVRIRDNGVGIDAELLPHIFDLFTQADRSLDRSQGGLGIGLSLARRLVELHGGTVEVRSPVGPGSSGSEFTVTLPLVAAPSCPGAENPADVTPPAGTAGLRVLIIDDNIDFVTVLGDNLRFIGYSVQGAHNGPDGLSMAVQWRPDVILLDIGLPGLDGYEVARRLRVELGERGSPVRLVAVTGYGSEDDAAQALEAGFDAHVAKPIDLDELERLMIPPHAPAHDTES